MTPRTHVVIVGGGFGGLAVARGLAKAEVDVTLVDKRNHHLFQPLLYQVATAGLSPSDIAEPLRGVLGRQRNVRVRLAEVVDIDLDAGELVLADGRLHYDRLVLATGARHAYFGRDDWEDHAPGLKTLRDALELRERLLRAFEEAEWTTDEAERDALCTFVVVGGGPTGVEMAGAIREIAVDTMARDFRRIDPRRTRVVLVEGTDRVLGAFPDALSDSARASLEGLGVEVRTGELVEEIDADGVTVGGERIAAKTVVWAAGVRASALGSCLGVPLDRVGRVLVDETLRVPGHAEVFVIGDLAHRDRGDGTALPGLAPVAIQMGQHVAKTLRRQLAGKAPTPFRYRDYGTMATIGKRLAVASMGPLRLRGFLAWIAWVFVHLMTLVGHRNRAVVFVKWAWAYLSGDRSSRLLWQDEPQLRPEPHEGGGHWP